MLEPKSVRPVSIESCNAPTAVITEMTENTPIVIPIIVKAVRNLFVPSEDIAIEMTSPNKIRERLGFIMEDGSLACHGKRASRLSAEGFASEMLAYHHDRQG